MTGSSLGIHVRDLRKTYRVPEREAGVLAAMRSLARRHTRDIVAVDTLSFSIDPGEVVGFLGPNGAGKTTTLKMLAGLLYPTSGLLSVLGHTPSHRAPAFLRQITLVMGNRNQLEWDLPVIDSFELHRTIYALPQLEYQHTVDELTDLLELAPLLRKPVRNLSLGERMKCEIAAALLHRPRVLFLDEPTLGLDVVMQQRLRTFIAAYNRRYDATVLLTSHYMADIAALCRRVIVIDHGRVLFDGDLQTLTRRFAAHKLIVVELADGRADLSPYGEVLPRPDGKVALHVPRMDIAGVTARLLADLPVVDLLVEDPPIEDVIAHVFGGERT